MSFESNNDVFSLSDHSL